MKFAAPKPLLMVYEGGVLALEIEDLRRRFLSKVERQADGCWLWTAVITTNGYGHFWIGRSNRVAHRISYELFVGGIPAGFLIDHLCGVKRCVNPEHLEAVTPSENTRRGKGPSAINAQQTQCKYGHPFDDANTYIRSNGARTCRTCHRVAALARYHRLRGAA